MGRLLDRMKDGKAVRPDDDGKAVRPDDDGIMGRLLDRMTMASWRMGRLLDRM